MKKNIFFILVILIAFPVLGQPASKWESMKAPLTFIIANDLGRNGYYDQKPIAETMGEVAGVIGPEAVLAPGDIHHFNGVASVNDPLWMTNFELIYKHPELMIDWLPTLGNHEYRGNTQAVLDYSKISRRWMMKSRYYTKVYKDKGISIRLVFIDTSPMIEKYRKDSLKYPDAHLQDYKKQLAWIDSVLTVEKEKWVVVLGHHPVYAQTSKKISERTDIQNRLLPVLKKHNVDYYICGHIHNFQHIRIKNDKTEYVVNSSASQSRKVKRIPQTVFCNPESGFAVLSARKDTLNLYFLNKDGKILYTIKHIQ